MKHIFRSQETYNSKDEADLWSKLRDLGLVSDQCWTEAVDEGHRIAFFTKDPVLVERVNARIDHKRKESQDAMRNETFQGEPLNHSEDFIQENSWKKYKISLTPMNPAYFSGWQPVSAD